MSGSKLTNWFAPLFTLLLFVALFVLFLVPQPVAHASHSISSINPSNFNQTSSPVPLTIFGGNFEVFESFGPFDFRKTPEVFISGSGVGTVSLPVLSFTNSRIDTTIPATIANAPGNYSIFVRISPLECISFFGFSFCFRNTHNSNSASLVVTPSPDTTPPATTALVQGILGNNGWYTWDVQVTLTAVDNAGGLGVAKTEYGFDGINWNIYTAPFTISSEGTTTVFYRSTDNVGNMEAVKSQTIKIDKTPPTISGGPTTQPNANGWYNENVTVRFNCQDNVSGPVDSFFDVFFTVEGLNQSASGTCADLAGNKASLTVSGINIDKTPPIITITSPESRDYFHTEILTLNLSATDPLSGISETTALLDGNPVTNGQKINLKTLTLGSHTLTVNAADKAGNNATKSVIFNVVTVPFASFSAKVEAEIGPEAGDNKLEVKGSFTLGEKSDGIDIPIEIVSLQLTGVTPIEIPAGSFELIEEKNEFKFEGTIRGLPTEMKIRPLGNNTYEFKLEVIETELVILDLCSLTSLLQVKLTIGDDTGETEVVPEIEGLENWESACPGIPLPPGILKYDPGDYSPS